jgi:hypothetical protein
MTDVAEGKLVKVADVRVGDRLRAHDGRELTVSRIDDGFMGRPDMVAFVEDTVDQWFKMPAGKDGEVELVGRSEA